LWWNNEKASETTGANCIVRRGGVKILKLSKTIMNLFERKEQYLFSGLKNNKFGILILIINLALLLDVIYVMSLPSLNYYSDCFELIFMLLVVEE
jgi:hypothetical protein